ncbi:GMC family oxidoreductase [Chelativorans salis]|uniref:GMC family oxidoreductase N-terminal domain-containing protein n=1 Tax=Chelativorans salis TaxID=2978478 RepID=A0ABT2LS52_9HYPH|nr:GMC family oxidoreductase N-terminal domain-containing protein [Chelativorans sp. EGI FJ00035]MCT7377365.1 GMC family oxidoreductase N-terminal domain-containing protein [Chelativorans sp. EGI FJ00035]
MTDFIIVGAGSAGCVLANRLSEDPANSVLLIEAGGSDWHPLIHMPAGFAKMTKGIASWGWSTVPQKHLGARVLRYTQAKVIGGGSSINAQIYTRGNSRDYDAWASEDGCAGWSYREVLPYFKRAEANERFANDYHGEDGPLGVSNPIAPLPICEAYFRAAQELGIPFNPDFNGARQEGVGYYQLTQRDARRSSAAVAYLKPVRNRPNLAVKTAAMVTRVVIENGRATGVELVERPGAAPIVLRAEREVIVSAGAIGSPKLLMQTGIGPADNLKSVGVASVHDLPGVGANLQDHLDLFVIAECTGDHTYDNYARLHRTMWAGLQYILLKKGPAASSLFETGGFWYADPTAAHPDIQFHLGLGSGIEAGVEKLKNPGVTLNSAFLRPRSRGTVRLKSADPADTPLIDPNYWSDPYDREMAFRGLRLARDIMRQKALERFVAREVLPGPGADSDEALFDYACRTAKTDHHPVGTCRMGTGETAVVTPELKVRGIEGLRVCDASVMPRIPSSNTNASAIMVGEKGADLVLGREPAPPVVFKDNLERV